VARSAALFVVRTLLPADVPMNAGVQRAVRVSAPAGCLIHAQWPSAVAAGNVETSQRITDTLFLALARGGLPVPAQGQGTMNNVTLGGRGWSYYETLGGGQGGGPSRAGPSGVHVGMSNTRNTPIEVLEMEFPLRVREYALRRGSGGTGRHPGGAGVVRAFEALVSAEASLLTERRRHGPHGAAGGGDGMPGRNTLNGRPLAAKTAVRLEPGDVLRIETPGGGGWGTITGETK
jgi:N-methylhydantoinase B